MAATVLPFKQTLAPGSDARALSILFNTLTRLVNNRPTTAAAALSVGSNTAKARTNGTCPYMVDGVFYSKASTDDLWTLTGTDSAASQETILLFYLDAAGTATMAQVGPYSASQLRTAAELCIDNLPALPDAKALIGAVKIVPSSAQTFVIGTDAPGTGNTATWYDGGFPGYNRLLGDALGTAIEGVVASVVNG